MLRIGLFIVKFLAIHPFHDGNGRISRILTTLLLLRSGYTYVPYASLESIIEQDIESDYLALRRTQTTIGDRMPDWDSWLHFFLRCLQRQTVRLHERLAKEEELQATLSPLAARLARLFNTNETLTLSEAATQLNAKPNTLKAKFRELLGHDLIQRKGKGREPTTRGNRDSEVVRGVLHLAPAAVVLVIIPLLYISGPVGPAKFPNELPPEALAIPLAA